MAEDQGNETRLVEEARRGEQRAYEELVLRHQDVAFRVAYLITRDADEAADATQQGFVKAYRALARFRSGSPFRPWLLRIVANEARNARRADAARRQLSIRLRSPSEVDPSPEEAAVAAERRRELLEALDRATEDDRLVIACRYFLEMSEAEMAGALGCAPGTVKSRLSRALGRLRTELAARRDRDERIGVGP